MAGVQKVRFQANRNAVDQVQLAVIDGIVTWAEGVLEESRHRAPDEEPLGQGLVQRGGVAAWLNGKKVAGRGVTKPKSVRVPKQGLMVIAGWGFPARFNEIGTVHQPGRPFFTPVIYGRIGLLPEAIRDKFKFHERAHGTFREVIAE